MNEALLKECRGLIANYLEGIEETDKVIERIDMALSALPVEGMKPTFSEAMAAGGRITAIDGHPVEGMAEGVGDAMAVATVEVGPHDHGPFVFRETPHGADTLTDGTHNLYIQNHLSADTAPGIPELKRWDCGPRGIWLIPKGRFVEYYDYDLLRTRLAAVERDAAVGAAIQRAAGELPDDYVVSIDVERGAASVDICSPDGDYITMDVDGHNRLASEINAAIDSALAAKERIA